MDEWRLRRIAKYLRKVPRLIWLFEQQETPKQIRVLFDADWAGDKISERSAIVEEVDLNFLKLERVKGQGKTLENKWCGVCDIVIGHNHGASA